MDWRWADSPGVALMGPGVPGATAAWARAAERAGLGSLWIVEDYFHPGAYAMAGAAASATERLTIGLGVVNPYTRHPALLAMETAALAALAPDRVVLGLGTSNRVWIEGQMGIPFKTPLRGLRESVGIIRRLLAGERVTESGECFSVHDVALAVPPAASLPILLGVKGPKALALAAEVADGVNGSILTSPAHVRRVRADDREEARARVRPLLGHYLAALHGQSILVDAGFDVAQTQPLRDARRAGRPAGALVTEEMIDTFAVAGTAADCRAALARLAAAGLDAPIAVLSPGAPAPEQIARIGATLVPAWRELTADRRGHV